MSVEVCTGGRISTYDDSGYMESKKWQRSFEQDPWCSGYHVSFTRFRSPVRSRPGSLLKFFNDLALSVLSFPHSQLHHPVLPPWCPSSVNMPVRQVCIPLLSQTPKCMQAAPYKAPHRVGVPHNYAAHARRCAHALDTEMGVSPAGSAAGDPMQEAYASAEMAGPGSMSGGRASLGCFALTSWDMQEQQALKQCTFAPQLNANSKARSVVAQQWKHGEADQCGSAAADDGCSGLEEVPTAAHLMDQAQSSAPVGKAAAIAAHGGVDEQLAEAAEAVHQAALPEAKILIAQQQQSTGRSKLGRTATVRSRRQRQSRDSYVAAALKCRTHTAGAATAVLPALHHPQSQKADDNRQGASEEQLQADVVECDRRLEQRRQLWCRHSKHPQQQQQQQWSAVVKGCSAPSFVAGDTDQQTANGQASQARLKVALEAVLPDGSASRFEVQQVMLLYMIHSKCVSAVGAFLL